MNTNPRRNCRLLGRDPGKPDRCAHRVQRERSEVDRVDGNASVHEHDDQERVCQWVGAGECGGGAQRRLRTFHFHWNNSMSVQLVLFNNCQLRPHSQLYGRGAFFDLDEHQKRPKGLRVLPLGQLCVVASYADDGVCFEWWKLKSESLEPDENGDPTSVFVGQLLFSENLPKPKAKDSNRYATFFNMNGAFKRPSMAATSISEKHLPAEVTGQQKTNSNALPIAVASRSR